MLGDYFTKPQQGSKMRRSRASILNLTKDLTLVSRECSKKQANNACTGTHSTNDTCHDKHSINERTNHTNCCRCNDAHSSKGESHAPHARTHKICSDDAAHRTSHSNDALRLKATSYLMAAKGLLNKVNRMDHFIRLT